MKLRQLVSTLAVFVVLAGASEATAKNVHVVDEGDTLWDISRSYGCDVETLRKHNALTSDSLQIGVKLEIPEGADGDRTAKPAAERVAVATQPQEPVERVEAPAKGKPKPPVSAHVKGLVRYTISPGDTLGGIASLYDTSVESLRERNGLVGSRIITGRELKILPGEGGTGKRLVLGQSIGATNRGKLRNPSRLAAGPGYFIRRPHRAFGANHTITELTRAIKQVRRKSKAAHRLAVGDISAKKGGKISMHASHQSGRDVDLGFYFKKKPEGYPQSFVDLTAKNLNFDATWTLLMSFVESASRPGGAEVIFISYETQKILYKAARKRGIGKAKLSKILQYPHGRDSRKAMVRHEPGHTEHMHVRFKCPPKDDTCK